MQMGGLTSSSQGSGADIAGDIDAAANTNSDIEEHGKLVAAGDDIDDDGPVDGPTIDAHVDLARRVCACILYLPHLIVLTMHGHRQERECGRCGCCSQPTRASKADSPVSL
jgi:hypothetical protein